MESFRPDSPGSRLLFSMHLAEKSCKAQFICHTFMGLAHLMLSYEQSAAVNWDDSHEGLLGIGLSYSSGDKNEEI